MAVGSAFDAYVKSYLYHAIHGEYGEFEKEKIFEQQVEPQVRDFARKAGQECFDFYKSTGALADLAIELSKSVVTPRFEFDLRDTIDGVPLMGKPDIFFINENGARCLYDWKVNGFCSPRNTSPMKGYVTCRPGNNQHKDCMLHNFRGVMINCFFHLEDCNKEWADQLSIYSWMMGEPVGSNAVVFGIDQITGPRASRVSSHRLRIRPEWQYGLMERIKQIWEIIESGWIFREMPKEENDLRLELLNSLNAPCEYGDVFD